MRRRAFLATVTSAAVLGAGCSRSGADGTHDIGMSALQFLPAEFRTTIGETIVWRNTSSRGHTVTAYGDGIPDSATYFASGGFDSEPNARDGWLSGGAGNVHATFEHTFEVPGTYEYFCIPHEPSGMVGTILVEE